MSDSCVQQLLLKGLEEEIYTGTPEGDVQPMAHKIVADIPGYVCEPDARNPEYNTVPHRLYEDLAKEILRKRLTLRDYLKDNYGYTLIPGATLSLGNTREFHRSKPDNPYHTHIEETYGTDVVTASTHINIGMDVVEDLIRAYRVIRCEAALFLALATSSPFLGGEVTGYHSTRWHLFPLTPPEVPLFKDHADYVQWIEKQLAEETMMNIRHLWVSTRPNGIGAPQELQRLELRICDRVDNLDDLMGFTALMESRVRQVLNDPGLDPLNQSRFDSEELLKVLVFNEANVSRDSLDAILTHWKTGEEVSARDWAGELLREARPVAARFGIEHHLEPLQGILEEGSTSMRWMAQHRDGLSVRDVLQRAIREMADNDLAHWEKVC